MKRIQIKLPPSETRERDTVGIIDMAVRYNLEYDADIKPVMTVYDANTKEIIVESEGNRYCLLYGEDKDVDGFIKELKHWLLDINL